MTYSKNDIADLLERALEIGLPLNNGSAIEEITVEELEGLVNAPSDRKPDRVIVLCEGGSC